MNRRWLSHAALNVLEHGLTRLGDAGISVFLIWILPTETFSRVALSQALAAPALLFFLAPEKLLYRDFGRWRQQGIDALAMRIRGLRTFAWLKAPQAILIAVGLALLAPGEGEARQSLYGLLWALSISLAPQICGADAEFLRMSLRLRELNFLSILQKSSLVFLVLAGVLLFPGSLAGLAAAGWTSVAVTALLARAMALRELKREGVSAAALRSPRWAALKALTADGVATFSLWSHVAGVIQNALQTLDLLLLGFFGQAALGLGLYGAVLKLASLSQAVPVAMSNLLGVWLGRKSAAEEESGAQAFDRMLQTVASVAVLALLSAALILLLAPWGLGLLSRGRWGADDRLQMLAWLRWILAGNLLVSVCLPVWSWFVLRRSPRAFALRIILPWGLVSLLLYGIGARQGFEGAAVANLGVGFGALLISAGVMRSSREVHR